MPLPSTPPSTSSTDNNLTPLASLQPLTSRRARRAALIIAAGFLLGTLVGVLGSLFATPGHTAPKVQKTKVTKTPTKTPEKAPSSKLLWEAWYTVVAADQTPVQYYRDRVELTDSKLHFTNHVWKREEGYLNEEQLGAFANSTPDLAPLFFNFRSTYRAAETVIDGTIQTDRSIVIKATQGGKEQNPIRRSIPAGTIFSSFFPVWVQTKAKSLGIGQTASFYALQEDDLVNGFSINTGRIRREKDDPLAKETKTIKLTVEYRSIPSAWWIDKDGIAVRIEMPQQGVTVTRTTETEAKKMFEKIASKADSP